MKKNTQYLAEIRKIMNSKGIDALIISGTDPHQSELPPAHWRGREWLTSFESENGTNGTAVITADHAYCWTDSRYFIQAATQMEGTGFELMKEDGPDAVNLIGWVANNLKNGDTVAIDGTTFSISWTEKLNEELSNNGIKLIDSFDIFNHIWHDRPSRPKNKLFVHDEQIVGESVDSKVARTLEAIDSESANALLLSSLDDIAWITNVRTANDIAFSPSFVSYLYLDATKRVIFLDLEKLTPEVESHFKKYNFETQPYDEVFKFAETLPQETQLLLDPNKTSYSLYNSLQCTPIFGGAAVAKLKSIKNSTQINHLQTAMDKDGVALTRFFMMVEKEYPKGELTEYSLGKELRKLRLADPTCVDESFAAILGWNANAALPHYEPTADSSLPIHGDGMLLVDSGGQYIYGTTDITRTIGLGNPSAEMKRDFTLVLKGNIAIATQKFLKGTVGTQLDVLARQYLWNEGKTYYHGTGHGVGFFLNVHEGPHQIRMNNVPVALMPGMNVTDEPGLYYEGRYGIRTENVLVVEEWETTEFGEFYQFKTLSLFPIDTSLIDYSIMTQPEIDWLNDYHTLVKQRLTPLLNKEEAAWLANKCEQISLS